MSGIVIGGIVAGGVVGVLGLGAIAAAAVFFMRKGSSTTKPRGATAPPKQQPVVVNYKKDKKMSEVGAKTGSSFGEFSFDSPGSSGKRSSLMSDQI